MKRFLSVLLIVVIALTVAGCDTVIRITNQTTAPESVTDAQTTVNCEGVPLSDVSPMLWEVTDEEGHKLYLFGTIHIGDERNESVVCNLKPFLEECTAFAFEFDTKAYQSNIAAMTEDLTNFVYKDGTKIYDHIPEEDYESFKSFLQENNSYMGVYDMYNTAFWSQLIDNVIYEKYTKLDTQYGMDSLLLDYAYEQNGTILEIESASFQYKLLSSFSDELYLISLRETVRNPEESAESIYHLYETWLKGDCDEFSEEIAGEYGEDDYTQEELKLFEDYNNKLVTERNIGMFSAGKEYLKSGKTVFLAVGCGHMVLDDGIVALFENEGYNVREIEYY